MKKRAPKSVVIVTSLKRLPGQEQLAGILDTSLNKSRWLLTVIDYRDFTLRRLRRELAAQTDGFIVHLPGTDEAMQLLIKTNRPTVLVNISNRQPSKKRQRLSYFWTDNLELGQKGAEHFLEKDGYRTFAFVSSASYEKTPDGYWSLERKHGFCDRLKQAKIPCLTQSSDGRLDDWLREIPKPAALMASYDGIAVQLVDTCRRLGIAVPNEISILGVDDIDTGDRNISSVNIDFRRAGQMEARELEALMQNPNRSGSVELMIPSKGVLCRKSTALHARSDIPVRILRFVAENACTGISVDDVVTHLECSRRLAELRFKQSTKRTIRAEIERVRLIQARKLLNARARTIREVARKCGYSSADILSRALVRTSGKNK